VSGAGSTDVGVPRLLGLSGTKVSNASVPALVRMPALRRLSLPGAHFASRAEIEAVR
jgi:hypothetical protein